jgi:hypothetical protein
MAQKIHVEDSNPAAPDDTHLSSIIGRTITIMLTNAIPLIGVVRLGWNASALVLLFVSEGIVVLLTDIVKRRSGRIAAKQRPALFFEFVFIFFFGFFAMIAFGPYESLEAAVTDRFRMIGALLSGELSKPLMAVAFMRLVRLVHDLADSGVFGGQVRRKLQYDGGGWMLLLFFAVMCTPLIARSGPNPVAGLTALVVLKTLGEVIAVWVVRIK